MPSPSDLAATIKAKLFALLTRNTRYEEFDLGKDGQPGVGAGEDEEEEYPEPERPPPRHIDKYIRPECPCLTKRYTIAVLTCVGFIISFGMRCNMGMAKLEFTTSFNETAKAAERAIKKVNTTHKIPFHWSVGMESAVDSSFFWGYLVTQVPGGFLASKYPANRVFGAAIATSSFLNLLLPIAADSQPIFIIIVRVLQGLVEGVTYPACHGIWRYWAPPLERSRLATIAFCGSYAGVVLGMPLSGVLTAGIGWQAPFYFYGVVGMLWYVTWLWLGFERPSKHPTISAKELYYIENSLGKSTQTSLPTIWTTPWKKFFTSMPVYAIIVANFCRSWNFYLLVLFQASYLSSAFGLKIQETGFLGALPHLLMTIIVPCGGMLADYVRRNQIMTTTNVRKVFNCGGFGMEGLFFIVVAYSQTAVAANIALTLGVAFSGFAISGYNVNHLDIAPRYASILMGMSNGIGTIAGLICPIVIDHITNDHTKASWKVVFLMAASVHMCGVTFYALFASGELQPWAEPEPTESKPWDPMENALEPTETTRMDGKMVGYGTLSDGGGYTNHVMSAESVQPEVRDTYMYQTQEPPRPPPPVSRPPPPSFQGPPQQYSQQYGGSQQVGGVPQYAGQPQQGSASGYGTLAYETTADPYASGLFSSEDYPNPPKTLSNNPFLN